MNKLIKTENILSYLKEYCTNIPIDSYRDIECVLGRELVINAVSYTHLTLPTIGLV